MGKPFFFSYRRHNNYGYKVHFATLRFLAVAPSSAPHFSKLRRPREIASYASPPFYTALRTCKIWRKYESAYMAEWIEQGGGVGVASPEDKTKRD